MAHDEPPHIDSALEPIRAAIQVVADGGARRITVYTPETARLLPAARSLARAAGVSVETAYAIDSQPDLLVEADFPHMA